MHIGINCHTQFIHALVVAVHHATAARYTGIQCNEQLAASCNVEHESFVVCQLCHCCTKECFGCINHSVRTKCLHRFMATRAQMIFVVHKHWSSKLLGYINKRTTTNAHDALCINYRVVWQQVLGDGAHICSGDSIPNNASPCSITRAVKSHNANRLIFCSSESARRIGQCS